MGISVDIDMGFDLDIDFLSLSAPSSLSPAWFSFGVLTSFEMTV